MDTSRFSKGAVPMATILALVFAVVIIGVGGYYAFFASEEGTGTTSSALCNTERTSYCNALLAGMPTDWKATCGIPPSMDECMSGSIGGGGGGGGGGCTAGTCDTAARRYCLASGTWSARDAVEYCDNCDHCSDGACQCGEDDVSCSDDCGAVGECTPASTENNEDCPHPTTSECDYTQRIYGTRDQYGNCDSSNNCVLDAFTWGDPDDASYCQNCHHCGDGVCQAVDPCNEDSTSCPADCYDNFIIQLYGDYDESDEYCAISIEGDSLGDFCDSGCNDCSDWEKWGHSIDTADYCGDGVLTVDFSDSYRARVDDSACPSTHRACVFVSDEWHCCEIICPLLGGVGPRGYGCNWDVAFDCANWDCTLGTSDGIYTCEMIPTQTCRASCLGVEEPGLGTCPAGQTCCKPGWV